MTINIPTPCQEEWQNFSPTFNGGFCSTCNKEVIDFTTWKPEDIQAYLSKRSDRTCGRFRASQLSPYPSSNKTKVATAMKWLAPSMVGASLFLTPLESEAQRAENSISYHISFDVMKRAENGSEKNIDVPTVIRGRVIDEQKTAMPGVNVVLKGTNNVTVTNEHGEFSMIINRPAPTDTLVFSFIAYLDERVPVYGRDQIDVTMKVDQAALSEVVIMGGVCSYRWYAPRGMWNRIKELFRRKTLTIRSLYQDRKILQLIHADDPPKNLVSDAGNHH